MKVILNPDYGLYEREGKPFCDSLQIAETFKRRHTHVIATIENLTEPTSGLSENFRITNFKQSTYKDNSGKKNKKYLLTKDGFVMVTMEFKTARARQFKEFYIDRFNKMEEFIKSLYTTKMEFPFFTEAVMEHHAEPKYYHFSNEINMIYRIVLGCTAKEYKIAHNINDKESLRPYLFLSQIKAIELLQRTDIGLLEIDASSAERKEVLTAKYRKMQLRLVG